MSGAIVLMYHVIDEARTTAERQWCCSPRAFEYQMRWLRERCNPVSLDDVVKAVRTGAELPPRSVCVTFDDGTRCLLDTALPTLARLQIPATAFVVAGKTGQDNDWLIDEGWSRRPLLSLDDLRELRRSGVDIGSHSMSHADFTRLDEPALEREAVSSKQELESMLGAPVRHFAYPYGRVNRRAHNAVKAAGYDSAFGVLPGRNTSRTDPWLLRRVEVFNWDTNLEFALKVKFGIDHARPNLSAARTLGKWMLETAGLRPRQRLAG